MYYTINMDKILAKKLIELAIIDQKMRRQRRKTWKFDVSIDRNNTRELKEIIKKYGWPTISLVGKKASNAAWLIAQHADHDIRFQKRVLDLFSKIKTKNSRDINLQNIAYLTDRILVKEKKKQIFGTQFYWNKQGELLPFPILNKRNVEKIRKDHNLLTLEENIRRINKSVPKTPNLK